MTDRIGQKLGNYHIIRLLGGGGFAEVYLGEHIHLGTKAAIKVLRTQLTADDIETFRNEARTIAQLEDPHIVRVPEFGAESVPLHRLEQTMGHDSSDTTKLYIDWTRQDLLYSWLLRQ